MTRQFTAIIEREDGGYVALCPELDIASQGEDRRGLADVARCARREDHLEGVRKNAADR